MTNAAIERRLHPEYLRRFAVAYRVWQANPDLAPAARLIGMTPWEWASRYIDQNYGPLMFTASSSDPGWIFNAEMAWKEVSS